MPGDEGAGQPGTDSTVDAVLKRETLPMQVPVTNLADGSRATGRRRQHGGFTSTSRGVEGAGVVLPRRYRRVEKARRIDAQLKRVNASHELAIEGIEACACSESA